MSRETRFFPAMAYRTPYKARRGEGGLSSGAVRARLRSARCASVRGGSTPLGGRRGGREAAKRGGVVILGSSAGILSSCDQQIRD